MDDMRVAIRMVCEAIKSDVLSMCADTDQKVAAVIDERPEVATFARGVGAGRYATLLQVVDLLDGLIDEATIRDAT